MARAYFGAYETFDTSSKEMGASLMGADNLVGDTYAIDIELNEEGRRAWLVNRFGQRAGFFSPAVSRDFSVLAAEGLELRAVLAFVAFAGSSEGDKYWGEAAVIAFSPAHAKAFERFVAQVGARIAEGVRPKIDFANEGVERIIDSDGDWMPKQTVPLPSMSKGSVIMKARRSMMDKVVEAGRARNKGCYLLSWLFIIVVVALVIWGVYALFSNA